MEKSRHWKPGEAIALRGMYERHPWYVQSAIVVKDHPEEVALLVMPGAECVAPAGYIHQKHGPNGHGRWERWKEMLNPPWHLEKYIWHTNHFLILLKPQDYYSTIYIWRHETRVFECFYINFQLPFVRSMCGIDTLDLELDIVINPDFRWKWKDAEEYRCGIECGVLISDWVNGIENAKKEVFAKIEQRIYPLDGTWLEWQPDPAWAPPRLPKNWEK